MLISLCLETDKKYSDKLITDIHSWSLTQSWEKSQCKKYLSYYFLFLIADLIKLMYQIIVNSSVISSKWLEIWVLRKGQKGSLLCFTMLQQCPHNRPSGHGNLLATDYKNHPVRQIRISKQIFMSDHIGNTLVCETTTHYFFLFCLFVVCCAIMFIFFM